MQPPQPVVCCFELRVPELTPAQGDRQLVEKLWRARLHDLVGFFGAQISRLPFRPITLDQLPLIVRHFLDPRIAIERSADARAHFIR
jgi:hypothetical protein